MVPAYVLTVDVIARDVDVDEQQFKERVAPILTHLDGLRGSFERQPSTITYYPPAEGKEDSEWWAARGIVLISVGRERAEYLTELYWSIVRLIELELPEFEVAAEVTKLKFS